MFDVGYGYEDGVTDVLLADDEGGQIYISPQPSSPHEMCVGMESPRGVRVMRIFTPGELNQLIGELQRARSGCFNGQWPRPVVQEAPLVDDDDDRAEDNFFDWLESFGFADSTAREAQSISAVYDPSGRVDGVEDLTTVNHFTLPINVTELLNLLEEVDADDGDTLNLHVPIGV
jgi:hypothetical protein